MFIRKTPDIKSEKGVSSMETVNIGGVEQVILMRGKNVGNPILLFLHGGPGTAQIGFARKLQEKLEEDFLVVNWDQRGSGLSFQKEMKEESMTIRQMTNDTKELIDYLLKRFQQKKVFLCGHSWGSILGILTAIEIPNKIHAYIGIGQVVNILEGEKLSYEYVKKEATKRSNTKATKALDEIGFKPTSLDYIRLQRRWLEKFGGSMIGISMNQLMLSDIFKIKEYTLKDWGLFAKGAMFSLSSLWEEVLSINLLDTHLKMDIPLFFCIGRHDFQTPSSLAFEYFEKVEAPKKEFFWFEHSAHAPNFEEPERFSQICKEIKDKIENEVRV